jgi:WD40 repeat protein
LRARRGLLASGGADNAICIWEEKPSAEGAPGWERVRTLEGHGGCVRALAQCGPFLVSASDDKTVRVWR